MLILVSALISAAFFIIVAFLIVLFGPLRNRCLYFLRVPVYFLAGDSNHGDSFDITRTDMRLKVAPYWRGHGWQVRWQSLTFQVGLLTMRVGTLDDQFGLRLVDIEERQLRSWRRSRAKAPAPEQDQ